MRLHNTLSRAGEEVKAVDGQTAKMYSCGPTGYRYIRIGHMRSLLLGDPVRRALRVDGPGAGRRQELEVDPNKRHPADFALWKKAGPGRAMKGPSPWGEGFPGWHIECSAMSMKHLGDRFDIHTGGNDNKFPHHEDELAQSEGYTGHPVVSIWVHGGFLRLSGQKIAKSAKNVVLVPEVVERGLDPLSFRLLCFGTRYRSEMDFSSQALEA